MKPARMSISSSIYRRIILLLLSISMVFFSALAYIIFSVNRGQTEKIIQSCGTRVSSIIHRALHKSMLINDNTELKESLVDMTQFSGIVEISIYNHDGMLRHSSRDSANHKSIQSVTVIMDNMHRQVAEDPVQIDGYTSIHKDADSGRILSVYSPILNENRCTNTTCHVHSPDESILGLMQVQVSLMEIDQARLSSEIFYFVLVAVFSLVSILIMITFTRRTIHKPMKHIIDASNRVAQGNLDIRIPVDDFKDVDMSNVGDAFNNMLDELDHANNTLRSWSHNLEETVRVKTEEIKRTQKELIHIERMASLGKLSSSVAHEINNPLAGVLTYTKLVSKLLKKETINQDDMKNIFGYLDMVESETIRCGNIVKGLLDFSRPEPSKHEVSHANKILEETRTLMEHSFKVAQLEFNTAFAATRDEIQCNPNQIKQVCIAVLVNAIEATDKEGRIIFTSSNSEDMTKINIEIIDNGSGIRQEDINRIFEPFFTRKKDGAGSGLGLAVTYGIVQRHKGKIIVDSEISRGTKFTISLPLYGKNEVPTDAE